MKKAIEILKKVYAIWEYSVTKEEIIEIVGKAFDKINNDGDNKLTVKDLLIEVYEAYKAKKGA